jgi:intraflagellar transport protein 20
VYGVFVAAVATAAAGSEIGTFSKTVGALTEILNTQSEKIEVEKLRAIGQRNRKDTETETRKRRQQELLFLIQQKQSELQRLHDQLDSLTKVEQEQKILIEKLNKN